MSDDAVPSDDPLQEVWRRLAQLDAHYNQDDYELDSPEQIIDEAQNHCADAIERRRDEQS